MDASEFVCARPTTGSACTGNGFGCGYRNESGKGSGEGFGVLESGFGESIFGSGFGSGDGSGSGRGSGKGSGEGLGKGWGDGR